VRVFHPGLCQPRCSPQDHLHTYFEHITPVRTLTQSYHPIPPPKPTLRTPLLCSANSCPCLALALPPQARKRPTHFITQVVRATHQPDPSHVTLDPPSGLSYPGPHLCSYPTGLDVTQTARFYSILGAHCLWIPADLVVLASLAYHHNDAERETPHNQLFASPDHMAL
jgi:hypothetical protein